MSVGGKWESCDLNMAIHCVYLMILAVIRL